MNSTTREASVRPLRDVGRWLLWTSGIAAGVIGLILTRRRRSPNFRSFGDDDDSRHGRSGLFRHPWIRQPLSNRIAQLQDAILGNTKQSIAAVFGPPPTASAPAAIAQQENLPPYWQAQTWYYPLDANRRRAIAIQFDEDLARRVEFIETPIDL